MTIKERLHRLVDDLPETEYREAERMLETLIGYGRNNDGDTRNIANRSYEERLARIRAIAGRHAATVPSSEEIALRKRTGI